MSALPFWWHSIDLGHGVVTPGHKTAELLAAEWEALRLPSLSGKSVLDIGAWDGYFSFAAERAGAARVVALDHFVWSFDREAPVPPPPETGPSPSPESVPGLWRPDTLPGKRPFDLARSTLGSSVEVVVGDFMAMDLEALGEFDIVLFLGVIYHMRHPLLALERLRAVTGDLAVIESEAIAVETLAEAPWALFVEERDDNGDPTNWWIPTGSAVAAMSRAAGFARVDDYSVLPEATPDAGAVPHRPRSPLRRRSATRAEPPRPQTRRYRALLHAHA